MKSLTIAASALTVAATTVSAGEIERRGDPSQILFEEAKNYLEFTASTINPSVSGKPLMTAPGASSTGNIQKSYLSFSGGYKYQLNDQVALAIVMDEPVGASVNYRGSPSTFGTGGFSGGSVFGTSEAEVSSVAYTAMAKYKFQDRLSVYGGLRIQGLTGDITVKSPITAPASATGAPSGAPGTPYSLNVNHDYRVGYLVGAAYEIPKIALRMALTYESKIKHKFRDNNNTKFSVEIPQAVTLHAKTGIAADTLLFGSVRWRDWSKFSVAPKDFLSFATGAPVNVPIAKGAADTWTYELGIGRRFNENWSGAFMLGYEDDHGKTVGNLSGKDGYISYGLGVSYENDDLKVSMGVRYFDIGNASSTVTRFSDNDAIAVGTKVAFKF